MDFATTLAQADETLALLDALDSTTSFSQVGSSQLPHSTQREDDQTSVSYSPLCSSPMSTSESNSLTHSEYSLFSSPISSPSRLSPTSVSTSLSLDHSLCTLDLSRVFLIGASDSSSTPSSPELQKKSPKRLRRSFTIKEKQDVLKRLDEVGSVTQVAQEFGILRRHLQMWRQNREKIESPSIDLERSRLEGGGRKILSDDLEKELIGRSIL